MMNTDSAVEENTTTSAWQSSYPILGTKLYAPPTRQEFVVRSRLLDELQRGLHGKLSLVSAPAGFGKTSLVSDWLSRQELESAWLSLDERENDPTRFLAYVVAALQKLQPSLGVELLVQLQTPQRPPLEVVLTNLLNELVALPQQCILVLDDYHVIEAKEVDELLLFLLENLPPQLHLVVLTREDPQLPLARLRARRQLLELRAADLRFLPSEAASFLNQMMGLSLSPEDLSSLEARTEGWIAGLQLAALSLQGRKDASSFIEAFAGNNRYIVDYLLEEVLQQQSEEVLSFLQKTSILKRLCGPLCDAVTGQGSGNQMLEELERGNLFVIPLDDKREWFRYHHLFGEVLHAHALREHRDEVSVWHAQSSEWLEQQGDIAEAIFHAFAAEDFERAARVIECAWPAMDAQMQSLAWLNWAEKLPEDVIRVRPVLCASYGWALLNKGDMEGCERWFQQAEHWLEADNSNNSEEVEKMVVSDREHYERLPPSIESAWAYRALTLGDMEATMKHAENSLALLPEDAYIQRGPAASLLSLAYWASGDLEAAYTSLDEAMNDFLKAGQATFALSGTYGLADIRLGQGRLRAAVRQYQQGLEKATGSDTAPMVGTSGIYLGLADLSHEQGNLEEARSYLDQSLALGKEAGLPDWPHRKCMVESRFAALRGDWESALASANEAEKLYFRSPVPTVQPIASWKARYLIALGRLNEARNWADEVQVSVDDPLFYLREFDLLTLARLLMAEAAEEQRPELLEDVISLLQRLLDSAEAEERQGSVLAICITLALAYAASEQWAEAMASLEQALTLAEPEGYVRMFALEGKPMQTLLRDYQTDSSRMQSYVNKIIAIQMNETAGTISASTRSASAPKARESVPVQPLIEPLSTRELEILELIAQGLSNREISETLHVALSTVKGHNQNIFGKLGVRRRTEAVARARALELV